MLIVSFFEWLNLDRFQEKYKSVWVLFMKSSLLSVCCECTLFTNLSDFAALFAELTLFFVVFRTAVLFALLSFMLTTADCFWIWVKFIQFCFMKSKLLVSLYWYTWSIKLSTVVSWSIDNVLISFLQVVTLLIFLLSLTSMNLVCSWREAEIDEALSVSFALIISSLFTYICFWSIRIWCSANHIKASSMIKSIWDIT